MWISPAFYSWLFLISPLNARLWHRTTNGMDIRNADAAASSAALAFTQDARLRRCLTGQVSSFTNAGLAQMGTDGFSGEDLTDKGSGIRDTPHRFATF